MHGMHGYAGTVVHAGHLLCTDGMRPQDYTCAQYKPETFEMLAYKLTIEKLVTVFGYPSVRAWQVLVSKRCLK